MFDYSIQSERKNRLEIGMNQSSDGTDIIKPNVVVLVLDNDTLTHTHTHTYTHTQTH